MTQPDLNREHAERLLRKAVEDEVLLDEVLDLIRVSDELIGFHCQQAAEKLLKAVLAARGIIYRRIHDLDELLNVLEQHKISFPSELRDIDLFTPFAVDYRYQEWEGADEDFERHAAREMIRKLRVWVESQIGEKI